MFRVALESILGVTVTGGDALLLSPCIPAAWPGFSVRYRLPDDAASYEIVVVRADAAQTVATLDGAVLAIEGRAVVVPLNRDGQKHRVEVTLGHDVGPVYSARRHSTRG
jgi:cyclic beta-1,2-glucan synthetase